jgi:hypothetical protein
VRGGAVATLFEHINYGGRFEVFTSDIANLIGEFIGNDVVSSIKVSKSVAINPGDLIKNFGAAVYYYGADNKRHVFPNRGTYDSWYQGDFSKVKNISESQMGSIALGSNMTYKPGVRMLKLQSGSLVYAVDENAVLRPIASESVAQALYGNNWAGFIDDLSEAFFSDYTVGAPINSVSDFPTNLLPAKSDPVQCHSAVVFTEYLSLGRGGQQVAALQALLQCLGFFPENIEKNNYFGSTTQASVKKFQTANGISPVGYVGPGTRAALNKY